MTCEERCRLVLAFARTLFVNGQATDRTADATERFGRALGLPTSIAMRWGQLRVQCETEPPSRYLEAAADPAGVNMGRVALSIRALQELEAGRLTPDAAADALRVISQAPAAPAWLFALAAGGGAVALAVIFGLEHFSAGVLIFVSAAAGAILRRALAQSTENYFIQPFCAAALAGVIGALAVKFNLSSSLRLVAVCPCMVLVPGPHFLNGAIDLINGRLALGAARFLYAVLIVVAISTGLIAGMAALGISLPVDPPGQAVVFWHDVIAAGVAVAAYSTFFSMPLSMLLWPVAVGMLAHALRWVAITVFGFGVAAGALVACVCAGFVLAQVSRRTHMPFAAIGFASVVSMLPGVYLFRMVSGLVQIAGGADVTLPLIQQTMSDGITAASVILAMSFGLILPMMMVEHLSKRRAASGVVRAPRGLPGGGNRMLRAFSDSIPKPHR